MIVDSPDLDLLGRRRGEPAAQRRAEPELFADSQQYLHRGLGAVNTLVLLTSSLCVVLAARAIRSETHRRLARRLTLIGAAVGGLFVIIKAIEYRAELSAGIEPATNTFFMYYFALTGLHLIHVIIGLGVLVVLSQLARKPAPTASQLMFFEGGCCFWHMVDLLWIVIFPLVFLVR
ncbi:cytochrome c oxidase subunit 3 [Nocardia sp. NPDC004123]